MNTKNCRKCNKDLFFDNFYTDKRNKDGLKPYCKKCFLEMDQLSKKRYFPQRQQYWIKQGNIRETHLLKFINKMYTGIKERVDNNKRYNGIPYCTRKEFVYFAMFNWQLKTIFAEWIKKGRPMYLRPTPDRIINSKGYVISNIQFLTQADNSRKQ